MSASLAGRSLEEEAGVSNSKYSLQPRIPTAEWAEFSLAEQWVRAVHLLETLTAPLSPG